MIDEYRNLSDAELLRTRGLFVGEGRLVVRRIIEDARYRVHSVLVNEASRRDLADALDRLPAGVPVHVRDAAGFRAITGFNLHRGCLALVHRPPPPPLEEILTAGGPILILEGVTDADNVGGAFRNAAAFGASGVILSPTSCDPFYRKAVRTSMAAVLRVPFARADSWPAGLVRARDAGFTIAALTPREPAQPLDVFAADPSHRKIALVIGTEGAGVSPAAEAAADVRVKIPMAAGIDSLNLSVAAGIALYALKR